MVPATKLPLVGARVMGLDDPTQKMSKSATGTGHAIALLDDPKTIQKKIARATTDSQPAVDVETMGPGIANLLTIAQACDASVTKESVNGLRYGDFKKRVAEAVIARLEPIQKRYREVTADPGLYRWHPDSRKRACRSDRRGHGSEGEGRHGLICLMQYRSNDCKSYCIIFYGKFGFPMHLWSDNQLSQYESRKIEGGSEEVRYGCEFS